MTIVLIFVSFGFSMWVPLLLLSLIEVLFSLIVRLNILFVVQVVRRRSHHMALVEVWITIIDRSIILLPSHRTLPALLRHSREVHSVWKNQRIC